MALPPAERVPVPSVEAPSVKVTVPVGIAVPEAGVTVALKVILVPVCADVAEAVNAVVVAVRTGAAVTVTVTAVDVLPLKLASPPYTAVMECAPALSAAVEYVATPVEETVPVPRVVAPSMNVTVPVGVPVLPEAPVTVAVKVTVEPATTVAAEAVKAVVVEASGGGAAVQTAELRKTERVPCPMSFDWPTSSSGYPSPDRSTAATL